MNIERVAFDRGTDVDDCAATMPERGLFCTLPNGHEGDHIAHNSLDQEIARWSATQENTE